jgi:hypothetical protein
VAKARPSPAARYKAAGKRTDPEHGEPLPVHSFRTLLGDLATLTRNVVQLGKHRLNILLAAPQKCSTGHSNCSASRLPRRQQHQTKLQPSQELALRNR